MTKSLAHSFLNNERGIKDETLEAFGITDDGDCIVFPHGKQRRHDPDGTRHFYSTKGQPVGLLVGPRTGSDANGIAFLLEGETDTLRLYQELGGQFDVFGIPGINAWKDEWAEQLKGYETLYVILDNDADYKVAAVVDRTWIAIRRSVGSSARRIVLPEGVNDLCEFFDAYNVDALRTLADRAIEHGSWHYEALDLTKPLRKPDWLVEDLIAKGDLVMMIGEPGVGKSWVSMSLAVALAEGRTDWMGRKLMTTGRVLYVDEENPVSLVPYRLRKLGLTDEGMKNIRFLHQQGVRLDRHPEHLLEEALDYSPTLIVLDSLTRIHTKDENNAGEISKLFNDGIVPLVRQTGANVLVLHHVNKTDSTSSFNRSRGSSDISGVIDCGLDIRAQDTGGLTLHHYKSRWIGEGSRIHFKIEDTPDGSVVLTTREAKAVF